MSESQAQLLIPAPVLNGVRAMLKRAREDEESDGALPLGRKKKTIRGTERLVHFGRHFGRTIRTFCNFHVLLRDAVLREEQLAANEADIDVLDPEDQKEQRLFRELMKLCPFLGDHLFAVPRSPSFSEVVSHAADMLAKGAGSARSDDVKSLKSAVIDWITPVGGVLSPPIQRNVKTGRGFNHDVTGRYLCPTDYNWNDESVRRQLRMGTLAPNALQWPILLYAGYECNENKMWDGLMRSRILVQAYKHVFTSPSSVDGENRATRSGNAQIHGMKSVTIPSLAYIATLVRFSLSSVSVFSRNDRVTDSEGFYNSLIEFLEEEEEQGEVKELLEWWNKQIFPVHTMIGDRTMPKTSALAKLKTQRRKVLGESLVQNRGAQ